ncbi:MAG TPA: cytochrome c biogenesis protein CcsA [Actinomycetota bacterium]|nr:cytochrome c biogenesis protein CcsA [Actinomycetota bacterium]
MTKPERMMAKLMSRRSERALGRLTVAGLAVGALLSLVVAPPDAVQGEVQRLMYIHVPSAWLACQAFFVVFVGSIAYLKTKNRRWDDLAVASAELGVLFTVLTIVLGSLWARPTWGTWWTWDPRLTTTSILLMIYVSYLGVRRMAANQDRARKWAAVLGIVGFVDVPIIHLSVVWWRTIHQQATVIRPDGPTMAPVMLWTLLTAFAACMLLYSYLLVLRMRVGRLEAQIVTQGVAARVVSGDRIANQLGSIVTDPATQGRA